MHGRHESYASGQSNLGRSFDKQREGCGGCLYAYRPLVGAMQESDTHEQDAKQDQISWGRYKARPIRKLERRGQQ